ncbi:uncharacterized protein LOC123302940 [Chrysoperla carnea]|uniref:uncharacterized protein LOC123302940 n=1 Tax=Chrysoperla carnea TaxID=189513 RepID=UPI001D07AF4A|nr:uncharacterized protein LOC123302940 [Chrysoperla carnea]
MEDFSNGKSKKLKRHIHIYKLEPSPSEIRRDFLVNQLLTTAEQFLEREKLIHAIKQIDSQHNTMLRLEIAQERARHQVSEIYKKIRSIDENRILKNESNAGLSDVSDKSGSDFATFNTKSTLSSKFTGCSKCLQKNKYKMKNEKYIFLDDRSTSLTTSVSPPRLKRSKKLDISCTKTNYASNQFTDSFVESSVGKLKLNNNYMWDNLIPNIKYFFNRCMKVIRCLIGFNKL